MRTQMPWKIPGEILCSPSRIEWARTKIWINEKVNNYQYEKLTTHIFL